MDWRLVGFLKGMFNSFRLMVLVGGWIWIGGGKGVNDGGLIGGGRRRRRVVLI